MKAIETVYNGYRFRSRLEARWAVFFDTLGIEWEYEKEGFDLDGIWYLPDFWLPKLQQWIEIKGKTPTHEESKKAALLSLYSGYPVYIFYGDIWIPGIDDTYDVYYDEEKLYHKATLKKGADGFLPRYCSLVAAESGKECSVLLDIYNPGTLEDELDGDIHLDYEQAPVLRAFYIADILHGKGDTSSLKLDATGRLLYLEPQYSGPAKHYEGRKSVQLPPIIRQYEKELKSLLSRKTNSFEWSIGQHYYRDNIYRWCVCPVCNLLCMATPSIPDSFPCYQEHRRYGDDSVYDYSVQEPDSVDALIEAYTAARQARF